MIPIKWIILYLIIAFMLWLTSCDKVPHDLKPLSELANGSCEEVLREQDKCRYIDEQRLKNMDCKKYDTLVMAKCKK
uniref:Lipoprotein n=1 Tax=viral metagenome TaxID=1070528 RepID=A0A6M3L5L5_9ZZZZ